MNIHSLQFHKNDLDTLLDSLNFNFDIIAISETKIRKNIEPLYDISLLDYNIEQTPTEASKGGTLLYISKKLHYKPRKDLELYEAKKIESTFIEVISENGENSLIGCIYRHHTLSSKEFTQIMKTLLSKLSKENKSCYIAGDFNMNLLQLENNPDIENYFNEVTDHNFSPLITNPTRKQKL